MEAENKTLLGIGSRVKHPAHGPGVIIGLDMAAYRVCFMTYGIKNVGKNFENWEIIEALPAKETISFNEAEQSLIKIMRKYGMLNESVQIGDKWKSGKLVIQPDDTSQKSKEIPLDTFFHKVVMVRDRLRVLEAKVNSNKKITEADKIELQQYITRVYGSLTTFNVLFKYKEDHFVGEKTK